MSLFVSTEQRAVAYHEAGHVVLLEIKGFRLVRVTITSAGDDKWAGLTVEEPQPLPSRSREDYRDRAMIEIAGPLAEGVHWLGHREISLLLMTPGWYQGR